MTFLYINYIYIYIYYTNTEARTTEREVYTNRVLNFRVLAGFNELVINIMMGVMARLNRSKPTG